jgi:hypothetical protein
MENKMKYLLVMIVILALIFPKLASADTPGMDIFDTMLEGIEEIAGPIAKFLITIFFTYVFGLIALYTSAYLLQFVTEHPEWLSVSQNAMVKSGWYFCAGIANMFLILVLVIIALAYILKIETFAQRKILTNLILVALLINFSLVFIGGLVDIANIFYNTILGNNRNLPFQIIEKLGIAGWEAVLLLITVLIALAVAFIVPYGAPMAQFSIVMMVIAPAFLPIIVHMLFQIFLFYAFAGIFFTLAFLFAARVFIVQIFAMIAPLAFLCLALPQTKKYWTQWLNHILEWTFFGIITFFFMVVGLRAANWLMPTATSLPPLPTTGGASTLFGGTFPRYLVFYFFIFVYLCIILWISKKTTPQIANTVIEQGKALGGMVMSQGIRPLSKAFQAEAKRARKDISGRAEVQERAKEWAVTPGTGPQATFLRYAGRKYYTEPMEARKKRIAEAEGEIKKMKDPTEGISKFRDAFGTRDWSTATGLLSGAIEKGGDFKKAWEKEIMAEEAIPLAQEANRFKDFAQAERIGRNFLPVADQMGLDVDKLVREAKDDAIKDFGPGFWKTPKAMANIQNFWGGRQIGRAADEFGRDFVNDYMKHIKDAMQIIGGRPAEEAKRKFIGFAQSNPKRATFFSSSTALGLGIPSLLDLAPDNIKVDIKKEYKKIGQLLAEKPAEKP